MIDYQIKDYKHHSGTEFLSYRDWLLKCFDHFYDTNSDVDVESKEKSGTLINSIKEILLT